MAEKAWVLRFPASLSWRSALSTTIGNVGRGIGIGCLLLAGRVKGNTSLAEDTEFKTPTDYLCAEASKLLEIEVKFLEGS